MTWKQLSDKILAMPQEQQETDLSVLLMTTNEVMPVIEFVTDWSTERESKGVDQVDGVLDNDHPYLTVDF